MTYRDALEEVTEDPMSFRSLPFRFRDNRDIALAAIASRPYQMKYASYGVRNDKKVVLEAVKRDGTMLEYASDRLRSDNEVVTSAVSEDGGALKYASERLRGTKRVVLIALQNNINALMYVSRDLKEDIDVVEAALNSRGANRASHYFSLLGNVADRYRYDKDIVLRAIDIVPSDYNLASDALREDRDVISHYITRSSVMDPNRIGSLPLHLRDDKDIMTEAVRHHEEAYIQASERLKHDRELVLAAVSSFGRVLEHVPDHFKEDMDIVLSSVWPGESSYEYDSVRRHRREDMVPFYIEPNALSFVPNNLRDNPLVLLAAHHYEPYFAFAYGSRRMRESWDNL